MTDRVRSGVKGLDELISGGFPMHSVNLVSGPAGSAKSIFCLHFILNGAHDHGEKGLFVSLEESREDLERNVADFGLTEKYEAAKDKMKVVDLGEIRRGLSMEKRRGMVSFEALGDFIGRQIETLGAQRVVVDSLSAVGLYYRSPEDLREEMFSFCRDLKDRSITALVTTESIEGSHLTRYNIEQFVADSFIVLGLEEVKGELRRTITIRKMRFTRHDTAKHPFLITKSGVQVATHEKVF